MQRQTNPTDRPPMQAVPTGSQFAADVMEGLSATPKYLSSKYFYDDEGSRLFQEIMKLPEYYLTGCEHEIFSTQANEILRAFSAPGRNPTVREGESSIGVDEVAAGSLRLPGRNPTVREGESSIGVDEVAAGSLRQPGRNPTVSEGDSIRDVKEPSLTVGSLPGAFDLIELGAGDGTKTATLIANFFEQDADISYSPVDISQVALDALTAKFNTEFPSLTMTPRNGDYFKILDDLKASDARRKVIMFLGSNIGNFSRKNSIDFFRSLRDAMNADDRLFIGFDLQKDPHVIAAAYDDSAGVTARFNLNLLTRINRELGGNFNVDAFTHYANYRPIEGSARSYLISRERQTVHIDALGRDFEFGQWEPIFTEISRKYSLDTIASLAAESGFEVEENFFDSRRYYCDSLWRPVSVART